MLRHGADNYMFMYSYQPKCNGYLFALLITSLFNQKTIFFLPLRRMSDAPILYRCGTSTFSVCSMSSSLCVLLLNHNLSLPRCSVNPSPYYPIATTKPSRHTRELVSLGWFPIGFGRFCFSIVLV